jgi:hypothetical protein
MPADFPLFPLLFLCITVPYLGAKKNFDPVPIFSLPLDILMQFRLHNCHEYHVRQNCIILLVVALLGGPGFGVLTKKHLQTAVGETTAVFLYYFT